MEKIKNANKIILKCNNQGIVTQIFLDTACLLENIKLPVSLHSLVSPISIKELGSFWLSIQEDAMEENTVLALRYNDKHTSYIFSGYLLDETVLLCGSTELTSTEKALEEIMLINNEQTNQIRLTEKKVVNILKDVEKREINEALLNDFSALNNELINNKRELVRKNQKIEILNKELNAVNQNMTLFTYSVSHDLKEPVRMVKSFLSVFHEKYAESLDPKALSYIEMALDGAQRLNKMLTDLLEYHQSSGSFTTTETVDLNEVFMEVKQILQTEIEQKKAIVTSEKLPTIKGSFAGYLQVFQNLLSNAFKFVTEGKTPLVSIRVEEKDKTYTIMIKDNGIGIAEDQKHQVFNFFKRLNSPQQYEGTGMGLAMVKKSIERMGGEVWLESEEGKGSTFYFTIKKGTIS
ncbi:sensor histidine kinase [Lunatibacter salilacus]|uniref:sensor histidine kinase n=1 Tax=Lunatibacter salilacus TaxID=2483804 RepID=UPI00131E2761|nr:ATP-binding protein [Lunatibacter salilacus]